MSGRSLHIGLNRVDPAHYNGWNGALNACEFDANDMETLAKSRGFETSKLLTQEATAGVKESDLELSLTGSRLTISGKREEERKEQDERWYAYELAGKHTARLRLGRDAGTSAVRLRVEVPAEVEAQVRLAVTIFQRFRVRE